MVFRISKIHTNADFTFSNNTAIYKELILLKMYAYYVKMFLWRVSAAKRKLPKYKPSNRNHTKGGGADDCL